MRASALFSLLLIGCVTRSELEEAQDRDGDGFLPWHRPTLNVDISTP